MNVWNEAFGEKSGGGTIIRLRNFGHVFVIIMFAVILLKINSDTADSLSSLLIFFLFPSLFLLEQPNTPFNSVNNYKT